MMLLKFLTRKIIKVDSHLKFSFSSLGIAKEENNDNKMNSWQVHSYGGLDELQLSKTRRPIIRNPNNVVIQVLASSVNPIDLAMMSGYGSVLLNFLRRTQACTFENILEFPLTLGRDFAGIVIQKGHGVSDFSLGDEVWGVVPIQDQGCHAEQVSVPKNCIQLKPKNLSMIEAGSMLYAAVTAWSALKVTGGLGILPVSGKRVLVLGASGGVGTMAVQMLCSWGAHVVATCSSDAIPLLESLGVMDIVDYKAVDSFEKIRKYRYDIILDCAGIGQENAASYIRFLKDYKFAKYITLKSPMVKNFDEYGILAGVAKNAADLTLVNLSSGLLPKTSTVLWGFFFPLECALTEITQEVTKGKIIPCIQKTYTFAETPKAYEHVQEGHLRGKLVIDFASAS